MTLRARVPIRHRSIRDGFLGLETGAALALAFLAKRLVSFSRISRFLGTPCAIPVSKELCDDDLDSLVWAFSVWRRHWPWPPVCLTEVIALRILFDRRGMSGAAHIAVRPGGSRTIDAHAWMTCGRQILPRPQDVSDYRVLSIFER